MFSLIIHNNTLSKCPSNFAPGIKTKLKNFSGKIFKKVKFAGAN